MLRCARFFFYKFSRQHILRKIKAGGRFAVCEYTRRYNHQLFFNKCFRGSETVIAIEKMITNVEVHG